MTNCIRNVAPQEKSAPVKSGDGRSRAVGPVRPVQALEVCIEFMLHGHVGSQCSAS
jgi:hypothetical protein